MLFYRGERIARTFINSKTCHSEKTAEVPPVADAARRFRGSAPVSTPQCGWKPADTTVCAFAHFSSCWEKWAAGGTGPTKENHPLERKRKPAKRERIPTTSLRTGLGMTGLAYERIFSGPIKSVPFCVNPFSTVEWRPFRRKEKIVLAFCRRGIYNSIKSIKGQSVRRLVRRRRNRVRSPASWSL